MKILIIADPIDDQFAGVHVYTKNMIKYLLKHDKNNKYILIRQKRDNLFIEAKQISIPKLPWIPGFDSLRLFIIIPLISILYKVNMVIEPAHFGPFNLPKKIKRVTIIHDLTPILFPKLHRFYSQFLQKIFLTRILKKANLIVSNSEHTKKDIIKKYPFTKEKVSTILLGKSNNFKPDIKKEKLLDLNIKSNYFLCLGTIEPRKNLIFLIESFFIFKNKTKSDIKLVIAGQKGWKNKNFYKSIFKNPLKNDILLTGYVEKTSLNQLYTNSLAFIYPSLYEGFGLPILEAMACGAPIICSNSSSMPEVAGNAALYFSPSNKLQLIKQLNKIYNNKKLQRDLSIKSLKQAQKFNWDQFAKKMIKEIAIISEHD